METLSENLAARPKNDLLLLYLRYMTRKRTDFDAVEIAADHEWANASLLRRYAGQLDRLWDGFVAKLAAHGVTPDLPWSADAEDGDRPGESDRLRLKEELVRLATKLETSRIINDG